jgi:8-oxo-dGTP pyrophosphatase MutT (NUDIX family)
LQVLHAIRTGLTAVILQQNSSRLKDKAGLVRPGHAAYNGSMHESYATGVSVTFTPIFKGRYLFVQREVGDNVLGGFWCFPGGKVHVGETLAAALIRECHEETGLEPTGHAFFVDSYLLDERVGVHFAVEVSSDQVKLHELQAYKWVESVDDLAQFSPRIPGIDTHLHYIIEHLAPLKSARNSKERTRLEKIAWQTLDQFDLVKSRFLNN